MSERPEENPPPGVTIREHVYDGIREYDQRLPNWWLYTLYGAIVFSVVYWMAWFFANIFESDEARVEALMAENEEINLRAASNFNNETLWRMSRNDGIVQGGRQLFMENCATCHGQNLEGGIGLDLADTTWKYGGQPTDVFEIVKNGSPDPTAGMQSWISQLGPQGVAEVSAFVLSYHREGEEITLDPDDKPPMLQ